MYKNLILENIDKVLLVKLNRPKAMNALNSDLLDELLEVFIRAIQDDNSMGILMTGAGDKAFVAGADIAEMAKMSPIEGKEFALKGQKLTLLIENYPKPVLAAVNGFALGGGNELAMSAHVRIASKNAKFGQPEVSLGLIPGFGGTQRLSRLVGLGIANELILSGNPITADRAFEIGLVNRVVEQDILMETSLKLLKTMISKGPKALEYSIQAINRGASLSLLEGLNLEADLFGLIFSTEDKKEGIDAFMGKRKAEFTGK